MYFDFLIGLQKFQKKKKLLSDLIGKKLAENQKFYQIKLDFILLL
jgi:hypothetical protein